ncbi:PepSY domain-containing protein [Methylobacterium organophilum]|uniref:PepSY-associated TM helix domain-containing protein n=1 Tax=Methylobacterium organophilum TaxID=410 RepID=UPI001F12F0DF|nr:PepSY domain-containing protein [Methylobacterium organophilum]UMY16323.1 PepSY domain-containing protein [Methylobacterium organophilum]
MTTGAPRVRSFRIWSAVHTWTSLISMAFLLMLCLTGLPLIFHHEIDHALGYDPVLPEMSAGTHHLPLDTLVAAAEAKRPGAVVQFVSFDKDEPDAVLVGLAKTLQQVPSDHFVGLDRRTATVLIASHPGAGPMGFLLKLHTDMFLGLPGKLFLGGMGLLFVAAIVSGVVLYGPFMRKLDFGTVRRTRSARIRWLDWHNLIGVATVAWALVVGATGTINTWADVMLALWQRGQLTEMTAPYRGVPRPGTLVSIDTAVATAQSAAPDMTPRLVAFPGTAFSSNNHYAVFMAGNTPLTARLLKPALIDAGTGRLTDMRAMPWYVQALFLSQPLHFGDYGGLPLKVVWALLDGATVVVLGSGLYLWIARKRSVVPCAASAVSGNHSSSLEPNA